MSRYRLCLGIGRGNSLPQTSTLFSALPGQRCKTTASPIHPETEASESESVQGSISFSVLGSSSLNFSERTPIVDEADFGRVASLYDAHDAAREIVIKASRDVIKGAKKAIYALHRSDFDEARKKLKVADAAISDLKPVFQTHPRLREEKDFRGSLEELAEALCFCHFLKTGSLLSFQGMNEGEDLFSSEDYVAGVCDFTGELGRYAVHRAIARDFDAVVDAFRLVDAIHGQLLNFDFRNRSGAAGDLRFKFDQIKWTLRKVEQLVYDCTVQGGAGVGME